MTPINPYLVTGAAGFIGARFVESCNRRGIPVISVDRESHFKDRIEHRGVDFGTIIDRDRLFDWLKSKKPELSAIVHMGACTDTMELDVDYLRKVNLEYSQQLWNYASTQHIPFVYASSGATYGDGKSGYDDDEKLIPKLHPLNPYGESKQLFDLSVLAARQHPPTWAGFKFFNVYGFGERHKDKMASVVLHAFDQIRTSGKVKLFKSHRAGIADGDQKRDFIFVDDVVDVLHFALDKPISRGIYNLGTGQARSYLDLARAVFKAMGKLENVEYIDMPIELRERYQYFTQAKMDRLRAQGYSKPFTSVEEGIRQYVTRLLNG